MREERDAHQDGARTGRVGGGVAQDPRRQEHQSRGPREVHAAHDAREVGGDLDHDREQGELPARVGGGQRDEGGAPVVSHPGQRGELQGARIHRDEFERMEVCPGPHQKKR